MASTTEETSGTGLVEQATSQVQDVASTAHEKAVELKQQGKSRLGETLDERTNQAGKQARQVAQALRQGGAQLSNQADGQQVASLAEGTADRVERLGGYLERSSGDVLLRDVEDFARRRPWMVAGIGLVAGVAASRFLKASSERRYRSTASSGSTNRYTYNTSPSQRDVRPAYDPLTHESFATSR
jgi:ElaB/YqjD/DUF883 family membrane-anchored ribosome-binding protein